MARQRYSFDEARIGRFVKEGRGTGAGATYKPWLTIGDVPSEGRSHRVLGLKTGRLHHMLSDLELRLFQILDWNDAVQDIREQFPLDRNKTQAIADRLGIRHPVDTVTKAPLVMTTDFLVDVAHDGRTRQIAYAVKPSEALAKPRVADKLDIERLYWGSEAVEWGIVTEKELPAILTRSIGWVHNYTVVDNFSQPYPGCLKEKAQLVLNELAHRSGITIERFSKETDQLLSMEPGTALMLVRHLIATKAVQCDMNQPLDDTVSIDRLRVPSAAERLRGMR